MCARIHPIVALLGNLALAMQGQPTAEDTEPNGPPELEVIPPVKRLLQRDGSVTFILGRTLSGKSVAAYRLAELLGRPTYAISPEQKPPYHWVNEMEIGEVGSEPPPYSTLILDDVLGYMSSHDYTKKDVREVERIIPASRHRRKLHLIFIAQSSSLVDKHVLTADLIMLKPPSLLWASTERDDVARFYREVAPMFHELSELQQKRRIYVLSEEWKGMVVVDKAGKRRNPQED